MLLGHYRPRLLVLTTPNFTFNARFHPPGVPRKGFLDPTGQTTRVFRHSDHKREWTVPEFEEWCQQAADENGYDFTLDGVGLPTEPDPFDRQLGYASQTALFVRRESGVESLRLGGISLSSSSPPSPGPSHKLVARRLFEADPRAGHPKSPRQIRGALAYLMNMRGEGELTFGEMWCELAMPCGGSLKALVDALMEEDRPRSDASGMYASITEEQSPEHGGKVYTEDTLGQWSILPPRNPNYYTEPRWDRVVVWSGFQLAPFEGGGHAREPEDDFEVEYWSDEKPTQIDWDVSSNKDEVVPVTPDDGYRGWPNARSNDAASNGSATEWGEWGMDDAAAEATWGHIEEDTKNNEILAWQMAVQGAEVRLPDVYQT
jgi:hypothetical protein